MGKRGRLVAVGMAAVAALAGGGCAFPIGGGLSGDEALSQMRELNGRGCIYLSASATAWGAARVVVVGTWGQEPPSYAECWTGLPMFP